MLRVPEVVALCGLKKTSIYRGAREGTFPAPVRLSARCVAWRESDIARWQASRTQAMKGTP
jgi:prophage regulatory protein